MKSKAGGMLYFGAKEAATDAAFSIFSMGVGVADLREGIHLVGLGGDQQMGAHQRDERQVLGHQGLHAMVELAPFLEVQGHQLARHQLVDLLLPGLRAAAAGEAPEVGGAGRSEDVGRGVGVGVATAQLCQMLL